MKAFPELTVLGQARRLRKLALNALGNYDLDVNRLSLITNDFNGIFRIDTARGGKYVLRVSLPEGGHDYDAVLAEMVWLDALARDTDLSVPRPLPARNGDLVVSAEADGVPQPRLCIVFSWVPGTDLARHMSLANMRKLGYLMARLHEHATTFKPPAGFSIMSFDKVYPFPEPFVLFDEGYREFLPGERRLIFTQAIDWAQEAIDRLKTCAEPMRFLHGDLHQWNVRVQRGVLSPIDFEDMMWGWPVQDIATTFYYLPDERLLEFRQAFYEGYTTLSPWPERYPGEIEAFMAARAFGLANFILNDPNPSWRIQAAQFSEKTEACLRTLLTMRHVDQPIQS